MTKITEYLLAFIAPLLAFLGQFKYVLVALTILVLLNYVVKYIATVVRLKGVRFRLFKALADKETIELFFKKIIEYPVTLTSIALFEVYFVGGSYVDFLDGTITLSKLALLLVGWRELTQINSTVEEMTGNNTFKLIETLLPEKLKILTTRKPRE